MNQTQENFQLILASKSPRRQELLAAAGLTFRVIPSMIDESTFEKTAPSVYVQRLAEEKALDIGRRYSDSYVLGADTVVVIDHTILEKPESKSHAQKMLESLSGRTHFVYTGYAILCQEQKVHHIGVEKTDVTFKKMSPEEIKWYIQTDEPYDKAGGYAIQGSGTLFVKSIRGSYTNVVGLPLCEVTSFLMKQGVIQIRT